MEENQEEEKPVVIHRPETLARIKQVQEWLICGTPTYSIVEFGMKLWSIQKTMMYEYIAEASKEFSESSSAEREDDREVHIQMLMQLYNETVSIRTPGYSFAGLHILKEVAKLKALYPSQQEMKPNPEHIKITLDLGNDTKTGKPENEEEV